MIATTILVAELLALVFGTHILWSRIGMAGKIAPRHRPVTLSNPITSSFAAMVGLATLGALCVALWQSIHPPTAPTTDAYRATPSPQVSTPAPTPKAPRNNNRTFTLIAPVDRWSVPIPITQKFTVVPKGNVRVARNKDTSNPVEMNP